MEAARSRIPCPGAGGWAGFGRWALAAMVAAALLTAGPFAWGDPGPEFPAAALQAVHPAGRAALEAAAARDPLEFLRTGLRWHEQKISTYTCRFLRQEWVGSKLGKAEVTAMKFREQPFSVYMKWTTGPDKGQEIIYAEGMYKNEMVVHPGGVLGALIRRIGLDPKGETAMKRCRRPITYAGMANQLRVVIPQCEEGVQRGDLRLEYVGIREVGGRPAYVVRRTFPEGKGYPCHQLFIYLDLEFLAATRTEAYDWQGRLVSDYQYTDLRINPGLTDKDFDPDNRQYGYRVF